jgi:hypothetical protein
MSAISKEIIGSYILPNGATVSIEAGEAIEYANMRSVQLSALSHIIISEDFSQYNDDIKSNIHWLVCTLAEELESLIPIVHTDAKKRSCQPNKNRTGGYE